MTTISFDFPVWFNATPLKHRTPKMVRGIFRETFELPEVPADEVYPAMSLVIGGEVKEYVEIEGRFHVAMGAAGSDALEERYLGANSPIPGVSNEYRELGKLALEKAKEGQLALFPKQAPDSRGNYPSLSRGWFSDIDVQWLEKRMEPAHAHLGTLRVAAGHVYEPIPEPMYAVNLAVDRNDAPMSVSMEFRSSTTPPFTLGFPVAFFRADQGDEAIAYAEELAHRHAVPMDRIERRQIVIHDSSRLSFSPYRQQILEAASLVMVANQRHAAGDKALSSAIGAIIGCNVNDWRGADQEIFDEDALGKLEVFVRKEHQSNRASLPPILLESLLERWDERPISLSAPSAFHSPSRP